MHTRHTLLPFVVVSLMSASAAHATVIDFGSVVMPSGATLTPGELLWTDSVVPFEVSGFKFQDLWYGYNGYVVSGSAGNNFAPFVVPTGHDMWATWLHPWGGGKFYTANGSTFTLNSLNLNWWDYVWDAAAHPFTITGEFADGTTKEIVGSVDPGNFVPLSLNWAGLKSVTFYATAGAAWDGGGFVGISDVVVNAGGTTLPIPEPASLSLVLAALALAGVSARRQRVV